MRRLLLFLLLGLLVGLYSNVCWEENGKVIWQGSYFNYSDLVIGLSDGSYMLMWNDASGGLPEMKMQRVSAEGENIWQQPILVSEQELYRPHEEKLMEAADGNIIAVWIELEEPPVIRCQKLDPAGNKLWGDNGLSFDLDNYCQYPNNLEIAAAPAGGVYIVFTGEDIKAIYLDTDGNLGTGWSIGGNTIFTDTQYYSCAVIPDSFGGFAVAAKGDGCDNILLQRCNIAGDFIWGDEGLEITDASGFQFQNWDSESFMVIYKDSESESLKAAAISEAGEFLYSEPETVATAGDNYDLRYFEFTRSSEGKLILVHEAMEVYTEEHLLIAQKMEIGEDPEWGETGIIVKSLCSMATNHHFHYQMAILADDAGGIYLSSLFSEIYNSGIDYFHLNSEGNLLAGIEPVVEFTRNQGTVLKLIENPNGSRGMFWSEFEGEYENLQLQIFDENDDIVLPENGDIIWQVAYGNAYSNSDLVSKGIYSAVAWSDKRKGNLDVIVQVINNETGEFQFAELGIAVSESNEIRQDNPRICFSDNGEYICIIWKYSTSGHVYGVQIMDLAGNRLAGENGIIIEEPIFYLYGISLGVIDNSFIVTWSGNTNSYVDPGWNVRAQKIENFLPVWGEGIVLQYSQEESYANIKSLGEYILWEAYTENGRYLKITKLEENGEIAENWEDIILNSSYSFAYYNAEIFPSPEGVYVLWEANVPLGNCHLYAQSISADGNILWEAEGRHICELEAEMKVMKLENEQLFYLYYSDNYNLELRQYDLAGNSEWEEPVVIDACAEGMDTWASLGIWEDIITVYWTTETERDVYAKFYDLDGNLVDNFPEDGLAICTERHSQTVSSSTIDDNGSSILLWQDTRGEGSYYGLYAQKIELSTIPATDDEILNGNLTNINNYPNPFMQSTTLTCDLPRGIESAEIVIYNIKGQKVRSLPAKANEVEWDCRNEAGKLAGAGVYFYKLKGKGIESKTGRMILLR
ncbi:MAG: T9SS type A sorting domain-containing protein [Candidatus Cloacimonetes bacterium]|nr:T9SS type A sorting domain-containing protein [Candidatus Cloacimonadota bacterium]